MRLGAILAGGRSTRFGSDKAEALVGGQRLIDHAAAALACQCATVIVIGRTDPAYPSAPDWPRPDCGPLGGLAGALRHARGLGFAEVLSTSVDAMGLAPDLAAHLAPAPAYVAQQPVIGLWPVVALEALEELLLGTGRHSVMRFAETIGARAVALDAPPANINRPEDLSALASRLTPRSGEAL